MNRMSYALCGEVTNNTATSVTLELKNRIKTLLEIADRCKRLLERCADDDVESRDSIEAYLLHIGDHLTTLLEFEESRCRNSKLVADQMKNILEKVKNHEMQNVEV